MKKLIIKSRLGWPNMLGQAILIEDEHMLIAFRESVDEEALIIARLDWMRVIDD